MLMSTKDVFMAYISNVWLYITESGFMASPEWNYYRYCGIEEHPCTVVKWWKALISFLAFVKFFHMCVSQTEILH